MTDVDDDDAVGAVTLQGFGASVGFLADISFSQPNTIKTDIKKINSLLNSFIILMWANFIFLANLAFSLC